MAASDRAARGQRARGVPAVGAERAHLARPEVALATHVEDVVNVLQYEDLNRVVLVGNSSGGMVSAGCIR